MPPLGMDNRLDDHAHGQYKRGDEDIKLGHEESMSSRPDLRKVQPCPSSTGLSHYRVWSDSADVVK